MSPWCLNVCVGRHKGSSCAELREKRPVAKAAFQVVVTRFTRRQWLAFAVSVCLAVAGIEAQTAIPLRIVSTSPNITETLFALGLGDRVVGVSTYCRYPEQVRSLPKVGTFLKPEPETIARLKPDLVYVHSGPNTIVAQLAALGLRTAVVDRGALPGVFSTIGQISAAAAVPERGDALVRDLQASLDRVRAAVTGRPARRVLVIVGRRTGTLTDMIAVGPGSYLHDLIGIAGGENVMGSVKLEYPRISMETVISLKPDVIVDVGEMGETPESSEQRRKVTESLWAKQRLVSAVSRGGVHAVVDEAFVVPGPRVVDVARRMAVWFHGVTVP
jgi:iron complex transport system substrate-binding protein